MENFKGSSNVRSFMYSGKLLPPKSPFPSVSPSFTDYIPSTAIAAKAVPTSREANSHHQRTSSENLMLEEQPSWLDDLLNEPETPIRRGGHRRSSSDSFAYVDSVNVSNTNYAAHDHFNYNNMISVPALESQDNEYHKYVQNAPFIVDTILKNQKNRPWESSSLSSRNRPITFPSLKETVALRSSGPLSTFQEADGIPSTTSVKQDIVDLKASSEKKDVSHANLSGSEADSKRAKQQFAQRSRVRKLQYIAELERNVQALQAEGSEVSAELEFLNQQNLILSMENKTLKQRLESLSEEQLIKYLEHEVLEREIGRLRVLYQQQQQQQEQQPPSTLRRSKSKDLDSQFANLSMKHKDTKSNRNTVTGPLHI